MAQRSKTVLKTYFETGKRPTQAQFGDLTQIPQQKKKSILVF